MLAEPDPSECLMMRKTLIAAILLVISGLPAAAEMQVLLRLTLLSDDAPVTQITLSGNTIDPNTRSADDAFVMALNGRRIRIPKTVAARLASGRRAYSYDRFTNGIRSDPPAVMCMMGGPAQGWVLETLYLTYDENSQIAGAALRPVLSEASNCLFPQRLRPNAPEAHIAAAKALSALQIIAELQ